MSQQAAKRRRKQAKGGYRHISPMQRPHYKRTSASVAQRRLEAFLEKQRAMIQRGKGKKK